MRKRLVFILPIVLVILVLAALLALRAPAQDALSGSLTIRDASLAQGTHAFSTGSFTITLSAIGQEAPGGYLGARVFITHAADPGRWLWHSLRGQAFVSAAQGSEKVTENRGLFDIIDTHLQTCAEQTLESMTQTGDQVILRGVLQCRSRKSVAYNLTFSAVEPNQLAFDLTFDDLSFNRAYLTYASDADEHFFGFGEQFSHFDHKGQRVPIWVSEQGIGRGQQPVTALVDLAAGAGGNAYTTYAAVPQYISSRMRSVFLENSAYSVFDLRNPNQVQVMVFSPRLQGRILYGDNPEALIGEYTAWAGRMRPLPDWILSGAVVGMQGGTQRAEQVYAQLKQMGTPVSAFWLQDWVGQRVTSFGKQLWWNWELDTSRYPNWDGFRAHLAADNVHILLYVSPFLADVTTAPNAKPNVQRDLFHEAEQAGYLVQHADGTPYLIRNTDFYAGLVDLTNPAAVAWYQQVLKDQLVAIGASGWMADFGEGLPYDALLSNGMRGVDFHNRYPEAWAQLNREVIDALPDGDQMVFFTRSAYQHSPGSTTLMWEGDQITGWDANDGIKSAVTGLLSGGMSGFSLNHSDIGGYTGINNPLLHVKRSKELLLRWMELSAFTTIYRTHEGNTPDQNAQFYTDADTMQQFDRFARVYAAWGFLRKRLVQNAADTGVPVARHLFIEYPNDPQVYSLSYEEFLIGPDMLVAPVLDPDKQTVRLYLPAGNWLHVWSGTVYRSPYQGQWIRVAAPIGQPAVFVKEGAPDGQTFMQNLRQAHLLP